MATSAATHPALVNGLAGLAAVGGAPRSRDVPTVPCSLVLRESTRVNPT